MSIHIDEEKWIPTPAPKLAAVRPFFGGSLRKRRTLATASVVLAVTVLGTWYWYIGKLPRVGDFWKNTGEGTLVTSF